MPSITAVSVSETCLWVLLGHVSFSSFLWGKKNMSWCVIRVCKSCYWRTMAVDFCIPHMAACCSADCISFLSVPLAKNVFRVSSVDPSHGQSHTLHVNDVYHKQQWLNCLRSAMALQQEAPLGAQQEGARRAKRRSSTISVTICDEETDENCPPVCGPKLRPQTLSKTRLNQKLQGSLKRKETGV